MLTASTTACSTSTRAQTRAPSSQALPLVREEDEVQREVRKGLDLDSLRSRRSSARRESGCAWLGVGIVPWVIRGFMQVKTLKSTARPVFSFISIRTLPTVPKSSWSSRHALTCRCRAPGRQNAPGLPPHFRQTTIDLLRTPLNRHHPLSDLALEPDRDIPLPTPCDPQLLEQLRQPLLKKLRGRIPLVFGLRSKERGALRVGDGFEGLQFLEVGVCGCGGGGVCWAARVEIEGLVVEIGEGHRLQGCRVVVEEVADGTFLLI